MKIILVRIRIFKNKSQIYLQIQYLLVNILNLRNRITKFLIQMLQEFSRLNYNYLQMQKTSSNSCLSKNYLFHTSNTLKKIQQTNKIINSIRSSVNERDDYCQFIVSDLPNIIHFIERSENKIKYTPKVMIHKQQNSVFKISVQCPKRLLLQYLSHFDEVIKAEIVQQIVETLFVLSERYGYFYCDRFMFKMSQERRPLVWINQNFKINQPEFPIQINSVSQGKFVKKIIKTFSQIIQFTKMTEIVTKQQLREYLKQIVQRFKNQEKKKQLLMKTKRSTHKDTQIKGTKQIEQRTISPKIRIRSPQTLTQSTPRHKTTQFSEKFLDSEKASKSKKSLKINKQRQIQKSAQKQGSEKRSNNKLNQNKTLIINKSRQVITIQTNSRGLNPQSNLSNISRSPPISINISNFKQDEDTVCSQMKQQRQKIKNKLHLKNEEKKIRKKSEDIQMLQSWIKEDRVATKQQSKYQNLTFSTGLTMSSLKGQLQNLVEHNRFDEERIGKRKVHNSQNQNQFHNQHKGNKQEGPIIAITQVEIEKQMDNLFDSMNEKQQNDISPALKGVRQSKLFKQLQILFVSTDSFNEQRQIKNEQLSQLTNQFSNILG